MRHERVCLLMMHAELVEARVRRLRVGSGMTEGVTTGPLISKAGMAKMAAHVDDAVGKGAKVCGAWCVGEVWKCGV